MSFCFIYKGFAWIVQSARRDCGHRTAHSETYLNIANVRENNWLIYESVLVWRDVWYTVKYKYANQSSTIHPPECHTILSSCTRLQTYFLDKSLDSTWCCHMMELPSLQPLLDHICSCYILNIRTTGLMLYDTSPYNISPCENCVLWLLCWVAAWWFWVFPFMSTVYTCCVSV